MDKIDLKRKVLEYLETLDDEDEIEYYDTWRGISECGMLAFLTYVFREEYDLTKLKHDVNGENK